MPKSKRSLHVIRMAVLLHDRLLESQKPMPLVLPQPKWIECERLARLHEKAIEKGWLAAAEKIRHRLNLALRDFRDSLTQSIAEQQQTRPACLSFGELHNEVVGLFEEFSEVECELRGRTLSVITEPVLLEEMYFGPFRIELDLSGPGQLGYEVIATDPNPAANDEEVTHPHVRDNCLCEGEGTLPIRHALEEGRLVDFFQIVDQILHTYNPGSPYIALDDWTGTSCTACGESVNDDERTSCYRTGDTVCYECVVTCSDCDENFCPDLVERCQSCDEQYCDRCLEEGTCNACCKEASEEETDTEQQTETSLVGCSGRSAEVAQTEAMAPTIG